MVAGSLGAVALAEILVGLGWVRRCSCYCSGWMVAVFVEFVEVHSCSAVVVVHSWVLAGETAAGALAAHNFGDDVVEGVGSEQVCAQSVVGGAVDAVVDVAQSFAAFAVAVGGVEQASLGVVGASRWWKFPHTLSRPLVEVPCKVPCWLRNFWRLLQGRSSRCTTNRKRAYLGSRSFHWCKGSFAEFRLHHRYARLDISIPYRRRTLEGDRYRRRRTWELKSRWGSGCRRVLELR